ncbi:hypothetical protein J2X81_001322 [Sinomonas atrocyanea]|nr:hypothetical protein [Sinomonas atrocyanea]
MKAAQDEAEAKKADLFQDNLGCGPGAVPSSSQRPRPPPIPPQAPPPRPLRPRLLPSSPPFPLRTSARTSSSRMRRTPSSSAQSA